MKKRKNVFLTKISYLSSVIKTQDFLLHILLKDFFYNADWTRGKPKPE